MLRALPLYRLDFAVQTATGLKFPAADHGFKGSAWHGRIDHVIRRHPGLMALRPEAGRAGAPSPYWIEAPEERSDTAKGPFSPNAYPPGHAFTLSVFVAARELDADMVQGLIEAVQHAGAVDPAQLTDTRSAAQRLSGRFVAKALGVQRFPTSDATPPVSPRSQATLGLEWVTMLRLDDGETLREASTALRQGRMWVPRLSLLASKLLDRCQGLGLVSGAPWLAPALAAVVGQLGQHEASIQVVSAQVFPCDFSRLSARAGRRDPLGGLIGRATYVGSADLMAEAHAVFRLAEWTRIGRKTNLGAGRIRVSFQTC